MSQNLKGSTTVIKGVTFAFILQFMSLEANLCLINTSQPVDQHLLAA